MVPRRQRPTSTVCLWRGVPSISQLCRMPEECDPLPHLCPLMSLPGDTQGPELLSTCAQGHAARCALQGLTHLLSMDPTWGAPISVCPHRKAVCAPTTPESFPGGAESRGKLMRLPASPPECRSPEASLVHSVSTAPAFVPLRPCPSLLSPCPPWLGSWRDCSPDRRMGKGRWMLSLEALWSCYRPSLLPVCLARMDRPLVFYPPPGLS